ncbi:MAG: DEAD/DEAH box helicase [Actinomycetia bacterium]|nr:DEAD/DEAH box helicase [Actinomycetes bacterium]
MPASRPVQLTRTGGSFQLSFAYDPDIVDVVRKLPYAHFDRSTRTWTCVVCEQAVSSLRRIHAIGLVDASPDDLLSSGEQVGAAKPATLHEGTTQRPFRVSLMSRDDAIYSKLRAIGGATWDKASGSLALPISAAAALGDLVDKGVLDDPDGVLGHSAVVVGFDSASGQFRCRGDVRADNAFGRYFPGIDVVSQWQAKGLDVDFDSELSEEIYRGELARATRGFQPDGLRLRLYDYQAESVAVALERSGFGVFDEMGLGKSCVAISVGHELFHNRGTITRTIVVVPGAVRTQFAEEIAKFSHGQVVVVDGDRKARRRAYRQARNAPWLVVHYDVLATDIDDLLPLAGGALLAGDEIHKIKNPTTKRHKAMRRMASKAARRMALSGTPVLNDPSEWHAILSGFIQPGCLGSPTTFLDRYAFRNQWGGYEGARNLGELHDRTCVYFARHLKEEVATHLPPLQVATRVLDTDTRYAAALRRAHREARDEIAGDRIARAGGSTTNPASWEGTLFDNGDVPPETGADMTAVGMLKLMCCSPMLIHRSDAPAAKALVEAGLVPAVDGPKLDTLRELVAELQEVSRRVVVFTSSKRMANLAAERLTEDGIRHVLFTGDTPKAERDRAVKAFRAAPAEGDPGPTVFLSTDAGGEGLNLSDHCSLLVNIDVPWTPGALSQRMARIHRVDSTHDHFQVVHLVLANTLEHGILRSVGNKQDTADGILGEVGGSDALVGRSHRATVMAAIDEASGNEVAPPTP